MEEINERIGPHWGFHVFGGAACGWNGNGIMSVLFPFVSHPGEFTPVGAAPPLGTTTCGPGAACSSIVGAGYSIPTEAILRLSSFMVEGFTVRRMRCAPRTRSRAPVSEPNVSPGILTFKSGMMGAFGIGGKPVPNGCVVVDTGGFGGGGATTCSTVLVLFSAAASMLSSVRDSPPVLG